MWGSHGGVFWDVRPSRLYHSRLIIAYFDTEDGGSATPQHKGQPLLDYTASHIRT
jgi:hypothetical protein